MPDMHENNMAILELVHKVDEAASASLSGIEKVVAGGPVELRALAMVKPEAFIEAFANLGTVITAQRELLKRYVESQGQILDHLERMQAHLEEERSDTDPSQ